MSKIDIAVNNIVAIADNPAHGYDQTDRWGEYGDYDCSSLMYTVWDLAGVPVKQFGLPMYTGTMYQHFVACGFEDVTNSVDLNSGNGLQKGDVLLNHVHHTAMYIGSGRLAEAQYSENQSAYGYAGDQTGEEIWTRSYYNYPWDCVLRYKEQTCGSVKTTDVHYQVLIASGWLGEITNYNNVTSEGYAGIPGVPIQAFRCKSDYTLEYRVHCLDDGWYNWRTNYDKDSDGDYYAGDGNHTIDAIQIKKPEGKNVHYRIYDSEHGWLPWVTNSNDTDYNGYAGWIGTNVELVQIYID